MKAISATDLPRLSDSLDPITKAWRAFVAHARPKPTRGTACPDCVLAHSAICAGSELHNFTTWHGWTCDAGRPLLEEWHLEIIKAREVFREHKRCGRALD